MDINNRQSAYVLKRILNACCFSFYKEVAWFLALSTYPSPFVTVLPTVLKPLLINPKVLFHQFRIVLLALLRALWLLEEVPVPEVVVPVPEVVVPVPEVVVPVPEVVVPVPEVVVPVPEVVVPVPEVVVPVPEVVVPVPEVVVPVPEVVVPVPEVVAVAREELLEKKSFQIRTKWSHPSRISEKRDPVRRFFMSGRCPILAIISSIWRWYQSIIKFGRLWYYANWYPWPYQNYADLELVASRDNCIIHVPDPLVLNDSHRTPLRRE